MRSAIAIIKSVRPEHSQKPRSHRQLLKHILKNAVELKPKKNLRAENHEAVLVERNLKLASQAHSADDRSAGLTALGYLEPTTLLLKPCARSKWCCSVGSVLAAHDFSFSLRPPLA